MPPPPDYATMRDQGGRSLVSTQPVSASSVDPAQGRDAAWIAYVLHGIGYLTVMMWPALIGLVINYVKRGDAHGGLVDSHHDWLIRTFWYGLLWNLLSVCTLLWSAWPVIHAVIRNPTASGEWVLAWSTIFSMIGLATLGAIGMLLTWFWLLYRVIRGSIQLVNLQSVP
ncbi:MAG TPA: hypothetical protein VGP71_14265 [Burkholderiales bacterium]|jgi:uncharacterized membrane protein|nr:hypothetical protein [Burkholderiales bacterium]